MEGGAVDRPRLLRGRYRGAEKYARGRQGLQEPGMQVRGSERRMELRLTRRLEHTLARSVRRVMRRSAATREIRAGSVRGQAARARPDPQRGAALPMQPGARRNV